MGTPRRIFIMAREKTPDSQAEDTTAVPGSLIGFIDSNGKSEERFNGGTRKSKSRKTEHYSSTLRRRPDTTG